MAAQPTETQIEGERAPAMSRLELTTRLIIYLFTPARSAVFADTDMAITRHRRPVTIGLGLSVFDEEALGVFASHLIFC